MDSPKGISPGCVVVSENPADLPESFKPPISVDPPEEPVSPVPGFSCVAPVPGFSCETPVPGFSCVLPDPPLMSPLILLSVFATSCPAAPVPASELSSAVEPLSCAAPSVSVCFSAGSLWPEPPHPARRLNDSTAASIAAVTFLFINHSLSVVIRRGCHCTT